ncbi:MAG: hypothetical protein R3B97_14655 [Dehalococcoidia bacterium]|nr:hypothetical protein [Dehalococcoidia bacterium]MCB9486871.1 hypothetical protein [Thermoflexaceae bacterium]
MANPLFTLAFDLFVITSAAILLYAVLVEHRRGQRGVVMSGRRFRARRPAPAGPNAMTSAERARRKLAA